jgi:hypothetical protein
MVGYRQQTKNSICHGDRTSLVVLYISPIELLLVADRKSVVENFSPRQPLTLRSFTQVTDKATKLLHEPSLALKLDLPDMFSRLQ